MINSNLESQTNLSKLSIFSWALYDFANTIFSMNVISLYFALWVTITMGGGDIDYSRALSFSMLLVALTAPVIGALMDAYQQRLPTLIIMTIICVSFTAAIGFVKTLFLGLLFFVFANYSFQIAAVAYNALLPFMSNPKNVGKISGFGVALGFLGSIAGMLAVKPFVPDSAHNARAFLPTAILFLFFSLPCFFFVSEKPKSPKVSNDEAPKKVSVYIKKSFSELSQSLRNLHHYPGMLPFLIARFLYFDTINTIISFMSIYAVKVMGFSQAANEVTNFFIICTVFSVLSSFGWGWVTDRLGAKNCLAAVLIWWTLTLAYTAFCPSKQAFWLVGIAAGLGFGGVMTSDRPLLLALAPKDKVSEFFGLYSVSGKFAAIVGPLIWGVIVGTGDSIIRYKSAVLTLCAMMAISILFLRRVPYEKKPA